MSILKTAKQFSGRSKMCSKCPMWPCSETMMTVCDNAYCQGFVKGVFWHKKELKKKSDGDTN